MRTIFKIWFFCICLFSCSGDDNSVSQGDTPPRVLVFYKTNGFVHESIQEGIQLIRNLGTSGNRWETDASNNSAVFTNENLRKYKAVVWCNTTGDNLLTEEQQLAFENFIKNGNGFLGIHAATDTYRDGSWPWYNNLVGAIIQIDPRHTESNHSGTLIKTTEHPAVNFIDTNWNKIDEYYYWERNGGYLYDGNINVLEVASTGNESYDVQRPIAWYKPFDGGKSFYTALGHNTADYTDDSVFKKHIEEALKWLLGL